jgi:rod shape-determining protein MreC
MHIFSFLFDRHLDKTVLVIAVAAGIVLLSLSDETKVRQATRIKGIFLGPVDRVTDYFASVESLEAENENLKAMVATLYQERERLLQFRDERERLRSLIGLREDPFHTFLACEVIGRSSSPFIRSVMVDRGSVDGIRTGMAAVSYRGLIGRVSQIFPHTAEVFLINNKSISVSCINRRSRVTGILEWDRGNIFRLEYVGKEEDIIIGDTLLTSGQGVLFPRGFPVGAVFRVLDERGGITQRVSVASFANLDALEELFIVTGTRGWSDDRLYDELEKSGTRGARK